jgi:hypothetical protein
MKTTSRSRLAFEGRNNTARAGADIVEADDSDAQHRRSPRRCQSSRASRTGTEMLTMRRSARNQLPLMIAQRPRAGDQSHCRGASQELPIRLAAVRPAEELSIPA